MVEKRLTLKERILGRATFANDEQIAPRINYAYQASAGTELWGGQFEEEYVNELKGQKAAIVFDKMRRSDPQVQMILQAMANPILSATWRINPYSIEGVDEKALEKHADFCRWIMFEDLHGGFEAFLEEVFTNLIFGFSLFWKIHKSGDSREFGKYTGFDRLVSINQRSVYAWKVNELTGDLVAVTQQAQGDTYRFTDLPAEFIFLFPLNRQGINYEGISPLRSAYGAWLRKTQYLRLEAVGAQRGAVGFPKVTVPAGQKDNLVERARAEAVAKAVATNEKSYVVMPEGWGFEMLPASFNPDTFQGMLRKEDDAMARAILANFLNLGQGGSGGAYSLGQDLSDFFLSGLTRIVNQVLSVLNRQVLPELVQLNFGPQDGYPYFQVSGIADKASKEYAEALAVMKSANLLSWSDRDEAQLRERFALAEAEAERDTPAPAANPFGGLFGGSKPPSQEPEPEPEDQDEGDQDPEPEGDEPPAKMSAPVKFAKPKPVSLIEKGAEGLHDLMASNLRYMKDRLIDDVLKRYESLSDSARAKAAVGLEVQGVAKYAQALKASMVNLASIAFNEVAAENPALAGLKFSIKYADPLKINAGFKLRDFKKLPKHVREGLEAAAKVLAETQAADLYKAIALQYSSSLPTAAGASILVQDLEEAAAKILSNTEIASLVSASKLVNETRHFFFFDPEVIDQIESFTFRNPSPVTTICNELKDRVFLKTDAESLRYEPPLHYNCKSYLEANEVGSGAADAAKEANVLGLSPTKAAKQNITLSDCCDGKDEWLRKVFSDPWIGSVYPEMPGVCEIIGHDGEPDRPGFYGLTLCDRSALIPSTIKTVKLGEFSSITFGQKAKETLCQVFGAVADYEVGSDFFEAVAAEVGDLKFSVELIGADYVATFTEPKEFKGGSIRLDRRGRLRVTWGRK